MANAADASDQLLTEARDLRTKQDARLATIQRQSQLVVAGFLAIAAIVVAAASAVQPDCATPCRTDQFPFVIPLISIVLGFAAVIGVAWFRVHRIPRRWREGPNTVQLLRVYGGGGLRPLRQRLVRMSYEDFQHNENLIEHATRVVGLQMVSALFALYILSAHLLAVVLELP